MNKEERKKSLGGLLYHLGDNIIGFDDEYETKGEKLGKSIKSFAGDPVGTAKAVATGVVNELEDALAGPVAFATEDRPVLPDGTIALTPEEDEDYLATMLGFGAAPAAPGIKALGKYDPNTANIFAGRSALSNKEYLYRKAEKLKDKGVSNDKIWEELGVDWDDTNKQWQFIIDPRKMRYTPAGEFLQQSLAQAVKDNPKANRFSLPLKSIVRFTELEENYPNFKNTKLVVDRRVKGGKFNADRNEVTLGFDVIRDPDQIKPVLVHELQHFVQAHDLSVGGTSPTYFYDARRMSNTSGDNKVKTHTNNPELKDLVDTVNDLNSRKLSLGKRLWDEDGNSTSNYDTQDYHKWIEISKELVAKHNEANRLAYKLYQANPGEAESRAAEELLESMIGDLRQDRSPSQRKADILQGFDEDTIKNSIMPNSFMSQPDETGFAEGGMVVENVDPVSGNEVPVGALPEEVRDDVDIKASEGEYVIPANVVRYFGVSHFEKLIEKANKGLSEMAEKGRIGGEPQPSPDVMITDEPIEMAEGGVIPKVFDPNAMQTGFSTFSPVSGTSGGSGIENKIYMGPDGSRRVVMFINGTPIADIPSGFVEDTPENRAAFEREQEVVEDKVLREGGRTGAENEADAPQADWAGMTPESREAFSKAGDRFSGLTGGIAGAALGGMLAGPAGAAIGGKIGSEISKSAAASGRSKELSEQTDLSQSEIEAITGKTRGLFDRNEQGSSISIDPGLMDAVQAAINAPAPSPTPSSPSPSSGGENGDDGDNDNDGFGGASSDAFGYMNKGGLVVRPKGKTTKKSSSKGLATRK